MGAEPAMQVGSECAEVSVRLSEDFRALYRAYRLGRTSAAPAPGASDGHVARLPAVRPSPPDLPVVDFGRVRLLRTGLRPLVFDGALAKRARSEPCPPDLVWHEISAFVAAEEARVVLHIAASLGDFSGGAGLSVAEWVSSPEAGVELLEGFDPSAALALPGASPGAHELVAGAAAHLRLVERARRDYVAVVRAFCGSDHLVATRLESRFGFSEERTPA